MQICELSHICDMENLISYFPPGYLFGRIKIECNYLTVDYTQRVLMCICGVFLRDEKRTLCPD